MTKEEVRKKVQKELFVLQDLRYRDFHAKLIPSVDKEKVIGIRTPALRAYAKKFVKIGVVKKPMAFCSTLHAKYHIDAFTGNVILVYNWLIFFKLVFIYISVFFMRFSL